MSSSPVGPPCHARASHSPPMPSMRYGGLKMMTSKVPRRPRKRSQRTTASRRPFAVAFRRASRTASEWMSVATVRATLAACSATYPVPVPSSRTCSPGSTRTAASRRRESSDGG